ncbi:MAG: EpsI domain-containing exosortase, partial [Alphaproteobacteria bacterium]|nr:EpsI domain-containing exosortase [Alphaproteobacteria bacterium]
RLVESYYVVGNLTAGSASRVKLATLRANLLGGDQAATAVLISTQEAPGVDGRAVIDAFAQALGDPQQLAHQLVTTARGR